ncbi:MAG TPA: DUF1801 domain-containing protein [Pyrinomonadaceae bacterium]|nr:DUF1801 domain-containing protein [Pyrinomonadaceae bacterium]
MAKKVEIKTSENDGNVEDFLNAVEDEQRRSDSFRALEIFKKVTGEPPKMWGTAIVGFGNRKVYRSDGGELDWLITGFSPRKASLTLYVLNGAPKQDQLLAKLGKHKASGGCLHIKKMSDVDETVLAELISASVDKAKA